MAKTSDVKKEIAKREVKTIPQLIQENVKKLGQALPSHMNPERLVRIAMTTLRLNRELYNCTPESFLGALFQSAQLGLEPNIEGQAYILPFNNKRKIGPNEWRTIKEAQFLIGYKGYAELFYRHEKSMALDMQIVKEKDEFDYALGTEAFIKHRPASGDRGGSIGYYAVATLSNGAKLFKYMSKEECLDHGKKHSKCYDKKSDQFYAYTPWNTNPDAMCLKTVLIQLMKLLPKSIEIQRALAMDETVKAKVDKDMFTVPDEANWQEIEVEGVSNGPESVTKGAKEREPGQEG